MPAHYACTSFVSVLLHYIAGPQDFELLSTASCTGGSAQLPASAAVCRALDRLCRWIVFGCIVCPRVVVTHNFVHVWLWMCSCYLSVGQLECAQAFAQHVLDGGFCNACACGEMHGVMSACSACPPLTRGANFRLCTVGDLFLAQPACNEG
jgi:hypothetical protein